MRPRPSDIRDALRGAVRLAGGRGSVVLVYHRVLPRARLGANELGLAVALEDFERHVAWLGRFSRIVSLREAIDRRGESGTRVALTFDDATLDFAAFVVPFLARTRIPAALFVPTGCVGRTEAYWWERLLASAREEGRTIESILRSIEELRPLDESARERRIALLPAAPTDPWTRPMTWEELSAARAAGVSVEAHTVSHPELSARPDGEVEDEIRAARDDLTARGFAAEFLAYPYGGPRNFDRRAIAAAKRAGFRAAFACGLEVEPDVAGDFALPRATVGPAGSGSLLARLARDARAYLTEPATSS